MNDPKTRGVVACRYGKGRMHQEGGGRVFYDMLFDILPLFFLHCFFLSVCSQVWNEDFVCLSRFLRGGIEFLLGVQYDTLSWRSLSLDP